MTHEKLRMPKIRFNEAAFAKYEAKSVDIQTLGHLPNTGLVIVLAKTSLCLSRGRKIEQE